MKHSLLLLLAVVWSFLAEGRAEAQYIFIDANGDGRCGDFLPSADPPVDVYLDTSHDPYGTTFSCPSGEPLSMRGYEIVFRWSGDGHGGYVEYGTWTNALESFSINLGESREGNNLRVGFLAPDPLVLPPGIYKLGTLTVTMTGCTRLEFATFDPGSGFVTGFFSQCPGKDGDYLLKLGSDFELWCGVAPAICDSAEETTTTWGKIKTIYR
jgi:hypothetical protein